MEHKLNIELLEKLSIDNLQLVKAEAEFNLEDLSKSEDIITNKANTLFQVLVVIVTGIIGYIISQLSALDLNSIILQVCIIMGIFLICSILFLFKIVYPLKTALKGSTPNKLITRQIFKDTSDNSHTLSLLRSRIYSIDIAIETNKKTLSKRVALFDKANMLIIAGLILSALYPILFYSLSLLFKLLST